MPEAQSEPDVARGRTATKVSGIPSAGWKDILWRTYKEIVDDHVMLVAAGVTFYALLALVPALTALVSVYGIFADPEALNRHVDLLRGMIPSSGLEILQGQLQRLTEQGQTRLGLTSLLSLAVALWSSNSGMKAIFEAMNVAYDEDEKRSFVGLTLVSFAFTLAAIATTLLLIGLVLVLPLILGFIGVGAVAQWAVRIGGFAIVVLLMLTGLAALYRWGPSRQAAQWRWITPGASVAIIVIAAATALFSWYTTSIGSFDATYGSLGAVFGFMTWLWIAAIIVLVGAEFNSEIEHQTERDTTTGRPLPMGARGARMADTVGSAYGSSPSETPDRPEEDPRLHGPLPVGRYLLLASLAWFRRRARE